MGEIGVKVPYVRQAKSGFYWEPSRKLKALGFYSESLGKELGPALARAEVMNERVRQELSGLESRKTTEPIRGTIAWVIRDYRGSRRWSGLAKSTQRGYGQCLDRIETAWGKRTPEAMTRRVVKEWQAALEERAPAFAAAILRVLRIVMIHAKDLGHKVSLEDFARLDLHIAGGREEPWEDYEISAYLDEAKVQGRQEMALAVMLGVCLGQREGDIISLRRSAYDPASGRITLKQHKTGRLITVPVLPELKREIEATPVLGTIFIVSEKSKKSYSEHHFRHVHRRICRSAGIDDKRKFMDLRHTAATRLGEAGCTEDQIQSITGHKDRQVMARYVRQTGETARGAITKLLDHRRRTES